MPNSLWNDPESGSLVTALLEVLPNIILSVKKFIFENRRVVSFLVDLSPLRLALKKHTILVHIIEKAILTNIRRRVASASFIRVMMMSVQPPSFKHKSQPKTRIEAVAPRAGACGCCAAGYRRSASEGAIVVLRGVGACRRRRRRRLLL
jgi:hypothetical protein